MRNADSRLNLVWDEEAMEQFMQVAEYVNAGFGTERMVRFLEEVYHTADLLTINPNIGMLEPLLSDRSKTYRSIVVAKLDKMAYYVEDDTVYIMAFWDCRSNPINRITHLS